MVRGFHYRFYPTPEQKTALAKTFGCVRYVFNWALKLRSAAWRERQQSINYRTTSAALTGLKRQPQLAWLNEVSCVPVQQSLRHLQTAFVNFWAERRSVPDLQEAGQPAVCRVHPFWIPMADRASEPGENGRLGYPLVASTAG
jgi:putative transposase